VALSRPLADVIQSVRKGSNVVIEHGGKQGTRFWGQTCIGWTWAMLAADQQSRSHGVPLHLVNYEDFLRSPQQSLSVFDGLKRDDKLHEPLLGHGIAGNRARRTGAMAEIDASRVSDSHSPAPIALVEKAVLTWCRRGHSASRLSPPEP